jgi:hypothetical protein
MVVKVSKPEINVREKISELDKPSGIAGQAMLAAETLPELHSIAGTGRRNLTINGDFKVNQRGTLPVTNPTGGVYFTDRWLIGSTATNLVISNETGVYINQDNAKVKTLKALFSGSGGFDIYQTYEDWEYLSNKTVTISFWYRTNIHNCVIRQWSTMSPATIPSTYGEWKKFSTTFTLGTLIAGARAANTATLGIWTSGATVSSGSYFEFTQFQLEVSKVATPFEHRSYGEELALCQRYYYQIGGASQGGGGFDYLAHGFADTTTRAIHLIHFPQNMRAAPTLVSSQSAGNFYWRAPIGNPTSPSATSLPTLGGSSKIWGRVDCNGTGFSAGTGCFFEQNNSVNTFIAFNAEL